MKRKPTRKRTLRIARHEAAHAVVAMSFRVPVVGIRMYHRDGILRGRTYLRPCRAIKDPLVDGIITMAGHAAEIRWHRHRITLVPEYDHRDLVKRGFSSWTYAKVLSHSRAYVNWLAPSIDRVARELVKRDLSGRQIRRLVKQKLSF